MTILNWRVELAMLIVLLGLVCMSAARATTGMVKEEICPVCASKVPVVHMMSTNNAGGQDRDFLERAGGGQPVLLNVATCPRCLYTAWADKFPDKVTPELKKWVLSKPFQVPSYRPGLRGPTEGIAPRGYTIPAWVRYDLMAQLARHRGDKPSTIQFLALAAAWSVRWEENPLQQAVESVSEADFEAMHKLSGVQPNRDQSLADQELAMARALLQKLDQLPEKNRKTALIVAAYLLRTHGEHEELLAALPLLKERVDATLEAPVRASVELERNYQRQVLALMDKVLASTTDPEEVPGLLYLGGELNRRLGQPGPAREGYRKAAAHPRAPDWLKTLCAEQEKLLP